MAKGLRLACLINFSLVRVLTDLNKYKVLRLANCQLCSPAGHRLLLRPTIFYLKFILIASRVDLKPLNPCSVHQN